MTPETPAPSPDGHSYASFDRVELRGADASAFAQAQLASDVQALPDGGWHWSAYLSPQGRAIALLLVVRQGSDAIDLLLAARRGADLAGRLQRFVFRSKVSIRVVSDAARGSVAGDGETALAATSGRTARGRLELAPGAIVQAAEIGPAPGSSEAALPDSGAEHAWRRYLVRAALPLLAGGAVEAFTPHALGLDGLEAISTRKGCYPGQEIVARTHFLGRNKRHLFRYAVKGGQLPQPGAILGSADGENAVANVVLSVAAGDRIAGLLVGHERLMDTTVLLAGAEVRLELAR